ETPASGLGCNLAERTRIDIQGRVTRRRMIQHVVGIDAERQFLRLCKLDALLYVRMQIPRPRPFNRSQTERAELSGAGIPQDDVAIRIRKCGQRAPLTQVR